MLSGPLPIDMIAQSSVAAVLSDPRQPDNPIVACNDAFLTLTGYTRDEVLGHNCRFLAGPRTEAALTQRLRDAMVHRNPTMVEILNYRKDGTSFRNAVMIAPVYGAQGQLDYFLGSQVEVPDHGARPHVHDATRETALARVSTLTPRQHQILTGMAGGKLNKQIAWELSLSERTIKMHRAALFRALGVRTSADAIRMAVEAGF